MSVGKRIRALRARRGIMNQEELAYLVGTARQTVSSWERDVFMPDSANLLKLAEALRTSVAYLMGGPRPRRAGKAQGLRRRWRGPLRRLLAHRKGAGRLRHAVG